jgi:hypothetical protein
MRQTAFVALAASFIALPALPSHADNTPLAVRANQPITAPHPSRGMTMAQVQQQFGAPQSKMDPRGGQKRDWPTINRWVYPQYTVYFQRDRVLDVVANKASANEVGPKPPVR